MFKYKWITVTLIETGIRNKALITDAMRVLYNDIKIGKYKIINVYYTEVIFPILKVACSFSVNLQENNSDPACINPFGW